MQALVLDCDGVILDSAREAFAVALRSYLHLEPGSSLSGRDGERLYEAFVERMPLGNRAEDFGTVLAALDSDVALPDQQAYDSFRATREESWLDDYHRRYYETRSALAAEERERWYALMPPYTRFVEILRRRGGEVELAIATAKDRPTLDAAFTAHGIAGLFSPRLILDKETGKAKSAHLRRLGELLKLPFEAMTFVDDKVNHLDDVAALGVRCALAAWGYNGPREHELARAAGYLVCTLDDVESRLFGPPARSRPA